MNLKWCKVVGDLGADADPEQFPTVAVCVECIAQEESRGENSRIVSVGERVSGRYAECEFCGRDEDEEE
jgi:hypothetical protein